jgi:sulfite exporter TauE/SafE
MFYPAIIMGFAGSLHCLGMCGPLVMVATGTGKMLSTRKILYNGGRIFTYAIQGLLVSSFGTVLQFGGIQNGVSIALGVLLIALGLAGMTAIRIPLLTPALSRLAIFLKTNFSRRLARQSKMSMIVMGGLNGILPCGLTYLALACCISLPTSLDGLWYMLFFGLGTLPVMLGVTSVIGLHVARWRVNLRVISTIAIIGAGVMLLARTAGAHHRTIPAGEITICQ